ncbi:hypothetical protein OF83DRAFT_146560 [Amylostereum chailletii]|nr:hypothetical protein OF83DRAFT_146560 [Amylostereum chailletii]
MSLSTPPPTSSRSRRPSLRIHPSASSPVTSPLEVYSDSRDHGYQGPSRTVKLTRATSSGGGAIAKSEDGKRCIVVGRSSLRILRMSDSPASMAPDHKSSIGRGGHRIDASRNLWTAAGFKVDSLSTGVAWGRGNYDHKILTSARNGDLLMWDLNKLGPSKFERRSRDHLRSIHTLSLSSVVHSYCVTGSADGDLRVWDLRDFSKSLIRIHHVQAVRTAVLSPSLTNPLQAVVGLDNGSIYRWDLKMGHKGQLDRLAVAHTGPILALDWCANPSDSGSSPSQYSNEVLTTHTGSSSNTSASGWIVSGGLDRTVKVWDLNTSHISGAPTYTLSTSFPVRRVLWRPGYECEVAVVSNAEFGNQDMSEGAAAPAPADASAPPPIEAERAPKRPSDMGDPVEIWDVRRGYIAKWNVQGSAVEGGVTDVAFRDSHALWAQHSSGSFSQLDLRHASRPIDAVPRVATTWDAAGSLTFVADHKSCWEIPYDDINPVLRSTKPDGLPKAKALGDEPYKPAFQSVGTHAFDYTSEEYDRFDRLARGYIFEGADKHAICGINAEVAASANHWEAAQTWSFMQSLYTPPAPSFEGLPTPPLSPLPLKSPVPLPHSHSAPAAIPTVFSGTRLSASPSARQMTIDPYLPRKSPMHSPLGYTPPLPSSQSPSPQRASTPMSATMPSPVSAISSLSASTPSRIFPRRPSNAGFLSSRPRASSSYTSRLPISSPSPVPSEASTRSLRHVGEGALDDSDSSSEESAQSDDSKDPYEPTPRPPSVGGSAIRNPAQQPSPLSRVTSQQSSQSGTEKEVDEDEEEDGDEDTPSPASTDSDSDASRSGSVRLIASASGAARRSRPRKGSVFRATSKSISRTRTRAAISVPNLPSGSTSRPPPLETRPMLRRASRSSMRTVTAGDASMGEVDQEGGGSVTEGQVGLGHGGPASSPRSRRIPSGETQPESLFSPASGAGPQAARRDSSDGVKSARAAEAIREREERMREMGWRALSRALEGYAELGDVQMCAVMAIVSGEELVVGKRRMVRFVDAYVELLDRLRLFASAAYLRKYVPAEDVQAPTKIQTTVYIACGKCEKPVMLQQGNLCATCKVPTLVCSICRLPVRSMAFHCPVCAHGGHLGCYHRYYNARPPTEIVPPPSPPPSESGGVAGHRGRSVSRSSTTTVLDDTNPAFDEIRTDRPPSPALPKSLIGHACAAGCGHLCWASNDLEKLGEEAYIERT